MARIRAELDSGKSASITHIVELIREVTCKFETISVQSLGEVIGRDLPTVSKVVSVAHTLGFNPEGVEISTINQAIHVIGFNKIRNLALSLMLVENASREVVSEKRNVAAFALVSGLVAQAVRLRQRPDDAEEAFVCAALRNYGRIMLANFLPDEYRRAVARAASENEATSFRHVFGITPRELSLELLQQSRMPRNIMLGLREIAGTEKSSGNLPAELELPVVADFAEEVCRLADDGRLDAEEFADRAHRAVLAYGRNVELSKDELFEILEEVSGTLNLFGALQPGHALNCRLLQRFRALSMGVEPAVPSDFKAAEDRTPSACVDAVVDQTTRHFRDPLAGGIAALMEIEAKSTVSIDEAYATGLSAVHKGLGLSHTIVFRRVNGGPKFAAWLGTGDFFAVIKGEELLDATVRDVFSVCLKRAEDVLIQNPADPKIKTFIPEWLGPVAGGQPLILLPVRDVRGTVTVFCGLRGDSSEFAVTTRQAQQLHSLRQRLSNLESRMPAAGEIADAPAVG